MSKETFVYTPGDGDRSYRSRKGHGADASRVAAELAYQRAMTWEPPKGHATWCELQTPAEFSNGRVGATLCYGEGPVINAGRGVFYAGYSGSAMSRARQCSCGKSATARHLRKLAAMQSDSAVGVAA